ncbi:MAG: hypothetical protein ACMXYB_02975 [Candidatus Woesearchaeota archaeon]
MIEDKTIVISENEYNDMLDYMQRLQETVDVLSNSKTVSKLNNAISRIESGEFLTKEELLKDV